MKAYLLYPDRDSDWQWVSKATALREGRRNGRKTPELEGFSPGKALPWNAELLTHDLGLDHLFSAMAGDADDVRVVVEREVLNGSDNDLATIAYRQALLADALANPAAVKELLAIAREAVDAQRRHYLSTLLGDHPDHVLRWAIEALEAAIPSIRRLRALTDTADAIFVAPGWQRFFAMIRTELDDTYLDRVTRQLGELKLRDGVRMSAALGDGGHAVSYVLHQPPVQHYTWFERFLRRWFPSFYEPDDQFGFSISPRDESGARALREFSNRGIAIAAQALGRAALHLRDFFAMLRAETAFYVGGITLHEQLAGAGLATCFPELAERAPALRFTGIYDPVLALAATGAVVANDANADGRSLIVITGANQGGKSTFLRAIGAAQLMAQAGLFVPAQAYAANPASAVMTHFKREEDASMASGKFDEELARMSAIVDHFKPCALLLFNESFAATAEREASEIADELIEGLRAKGGKVVFVTHLFEYAHGVAGRADPAALFLRADRAPDGSRPFRVIEGEPLATSYGQDLYRAVFDGDGNGGDVVAFTS